MKTLYDIVSSTSTFLLKEQVQIMLDHGFVLHGELKVGTEDNKPLFTQALIKTVEEPPKAPEKKCADCGSPLKDDPASAECNECLGTGFKSGDMVRFKSGDRTYKVACVPMLPHGPMVGIFDNPPGTHIDYFKPQTLALVSRHKP